MTDPQPGDGNPYAVPEAPREPHPDDGRRALPPAVDAPPRDRPAYGTPQSAGGGPAGVSGDDRKAALRAMRWTALLGAVAVTSAVLLPPLGIALGVLVIVRALLVRPQLARARIGVAAVVGPVISGVLAIVVGAVLTVTLALSWQELEAYRSCISGANTEIAEERCRAELQDSATVPDWLLGFA